MTRLKLPASKRVYLLVALILLLAFAEAAWLSIRRYLGFNALAFDLGVMSQAIWSVTQGEPLVFSQQGIIFSRLARHVELIYLPLALLYKIWPAPPALLAAQAALYALGGLPVFRLARRRLGQDRPALVVVLVYLLYPVAQTAVLFDIHGDTLAMPLLLFMLDSLDRRAWRTYALWLGLALICKVYVAVAIAALGGVLWLKGERRAGLLTFAAAALWGAFAFFGMRALFAPPEAAIVHATTGSYLTQYFSAADLGQTWLPRLLNGVIVLLPVLPLAVYAPLWLLPGLLVTAAVLVSNGPGPTYLFRYHHYAIAVPFLIMAVLAGAGRRRGRQESAPPRPGLAWRLQLMVVFLITLLFNVYFVNSPLNPEFYRHRQFAGRQPAIYGVTDRDRFLADWLPAHIPAAAPVLADTYLATHLSNRPVLYLTDYDRAVRPFADLLPEVDYVLFDTFTDPLWPEHFDWWTGRLGAVAAQPGWTPVALEDGLILFGRTAPGLPFSLDEAPGPAADLLADFDGRIGLAAAAAVPLGDNRFELHYTWTILAPPAELPPMLAVTTVDGWDHGRLPHPATMITPPQTWTAGALVREVMTIQLPPDLPPGSYAVGVNWYDYAALNRLAAGGEDLPAPAGISLAIPVP